MGDTVLTILFCLYKDGEKINQEKPVFLKMPVFFWFCLSAGDRLFLLARKIPASSQVSK